MNIQVNNTYNYFDDGKIYKSRMLPVTITEIIPFDAIDDETLFLWKTECKECDWLFSKETDYFIKGTLKITTDIEEHIVFVKSIKEGWFSIGEWAGRLDYDGSLTATLNI